MQGPQAVSRNKFSLITFKVPRKGMTGSLPKRAGKSMKLLKDFETKTLPRLILSSDGYCELRSHRSRLEPNTTTYDRAIVRHDPSSFIHVLATIRYLLSLEQVLPRLPRLEQVLPSLVVLPLTYYGPVEFRYLPESFYYELKALGEISYDSVCSSRGTEAIRTYYNGRIFDETETQVMTTDGKLVQFAELPKEERKELKSAFETSLREFQESCDENVIN